MAVGYGLLMPQQSFIDIKDSNSKCKRKRRIGTCVVLTEAFFMLNPSLRLYCDLTTNKRRKLREESNGFCKNEITAYNRIAWGWWLIITKTMWNVCFSPRFCLSQMNLRELLCLFSFFSCFLLYSVAVSEMRKETLHGTFTQLP